jgi:hypothetical protein
VLEPELAVADQVSDDPTQTSAPDAAIVESREKSGSTTLPSSLFEKAAGAAGAREPPSLPPPMPDDALAQEYRKLFVEFTKLRQTCREPVDNLDAERFVRALRRERAELIRKHASKDVRFHLSFQNGKAAIRFTTVA